MTCEYAGLCRKFSYASGSVCVSESRESVCSFYKVYEGLKGLEESDKLAEVGK